MTEIAKIAHTSPLNGETMRGSFTARARASRGRPTISLRIEQGRKVFAKLANVDTKKGVKIKPLAPGSYTAVWTVTNRNGDTRTVTTRFIEAAGD